MDPLTSLALATATFAGTHLLMLHALRAGLVRPLGAHCSADQNEWAAGMPPPIVSSVSNV